MNEIPGMPVGDHDGGANRHVMPLDECRDVSARALRAAFAEALDQLRPELIRVIDMAMGADVYYVYMGALELIRDNRNEIESAFHAAFLRRFNRACLHETRSPEGLADNAKLSLLATDDLEESLASNSLATAIRDVCGEELFGLEKRVGLLINDPDLAYSENPLGPDVIARAMMDALTGFEANIKSRLLVMTQLSKRLPMAVRDIYRDINQLLVRRNVLPTIRVGLRRPDQGAPERECDRHHEAPVEPEHGDDLFAMFQRFIGAGSADGGMSSSVRHAMSIDPAASGPSRSILGALDQLQRGASTGLAWSGLEADALRSGRANVLHGLRNGGMAHANALDQMTLDIVAMVFDYILGDSRIPDAMKALIGRLQIPVLKVAMLDKEFFSRRNHPARKLLDGLADAAIRLDSVQAHDSPLYRRAERLVGRILESFDDRLDIFTDAASELNGFVAEESGKADSTARLGIEAIRAREAAESSAEAAREAVEARLAGHPVPLGIRVFVVKHWQRLLADIHLRSGVNGTAWRIALTTLENLVWSVEPKFDPVERASLVGMLPGLLKQLEMGADTLDLPQDDRELFFATLVPCHTLALKCIQLEDGMENLPEGTETPSAPPVSNDFEAVRLVPGKTANAATDVAAGNSDIDGLVIGSWIQYRNEGGEYVTTRLSWISPLKGLYMFTNNRDQTAISITARGLREKLHGGEVRIVDDEPLMDRVVDNLMDRFRSGPA